MRTLWFFGITCLSLIVGLSLADEAPRKGKVRRIPPFNYQSQEIHYLGFRPETDPSRRVDPELHERYLYSPQAERDRWWREATDRMLADQQKARGTPVAHQLRDILTYIPITVGADD